MGRKSNSANATNIAKVLNQKIRDAIIKRIKDTGSNQSKLAAMMDKSRANVSVLLNQDNVMTIPTIIEFCLALDLGFDIVIKEKSDVSIKISKDE